MADDEPDEKIELVLPSCPHCGIKQLFEEGYPEVTMGDVLCFLMHTAADYILENTPESHHDMAFDYIKARLDESRRQLESDNASDNATEIMPDSDEGTAH